MLRRSLAKQSMEHCPNGTSSGGEGASQYLLVVFT